MKYDFYNTGNLYKPKLAIQARNRLHRILLEGLNPKSILEVGVGFGELAKFCLERNVQWTGVDANQNLIDTLSAEGFKLYRANMPEFPQIEENFQIIFAAHFIEHLKDYSEAFQFLEQSKKLLEKNGGGHVVLLFPDIEKIGHYFWQDYTHSFVTTKKRIEDMLYDAGYKLERSGHYTACFFASSTLISLAGKVFPYFLLPRKQAEFARLSFQQHGYAIARV